MGWRFVSRVLGIANTVVLVRLLVPSDFGLVALATSFSFSIDGLSYIGVQDALVRERGLDRAMYDTGFTLTALRGLITALLIVACAWPAAQFFGDTRLTTIFLVLALALLLSSLENIGTVDFQREMAFVRQIQVLIVPRVVSVIASIAYAVVFKSYWALVVGIVVNRSTRLLFTYVIHPYRPRLTLRAWRRLVGFSFWSWALSMVALVQARADTIILGGYLNPTAVGIYSVGGEVGGLASSELVGPMGAALFGGFASARRSGDGLAWAYNRAIAVVALLTLPTSAGIALLARPLMHLAFGARWDAAVPLVQLFAFIGVCRAGGTVSVILLTVEGMLTVNFRIELVLTVLRIVILLVAVPVYGVIGAACGVAAAGLIEEAIYLVVTFRHMRLRARDFVFGVWRPVLATGVMSVAVSTVELHWPHMESGAIWEGFHFGATVLVGAVVYCAALLLVWQAVGRPRGAETYVLGLAQPVLHRWIGR